MKRAVILYAPRPAPAPRPAAPLPLLALARMCDPRTNPVVVVNGTTDPRPLRRIIESLPSALLLGISSMTGYQIRDGLRVAREVRRIRPDLPIVWGGYHPSLLPEQTLADPGVDLIVRGQGEGPFQRLVESFSQGGNGRGIPGVIGQERSWGEHASSDEHEREGEAQVRRKHSGGGEGQGGSGHEGDAELPHPLDLDTLPFLAWDLADEGSFPQHPGGGLAVDFYTSQGCPHHCAFCAEPAMHRRRRTRLSPLRAVEEIAHLAERGVRAVHLRDTLFFADGRWIDSFCEEVLKRELPVEFYGANGRVDTLLGWTRDRWDLIERAGFREVLLGIESGHPPALRRICKGIEPADSLDLLRNAAGSRLRFFLTAMVGLPDVDPEAEFIDTVAHLRELMAVQPGQVSSVYLFVYTPYPGSELYEDALRSGFRAPESLEGWGRMDFHRHDYPWGSDARRRQAANLTRFILPRILHREPSRLPLVEAVNRALDPRLERRWREGRFDRFWEQGVYRFFDGLRRVKRRV